MTCDEIERDDTAEQYVAGTLVEETRARFEEHYFSCERCLERVEQLESAGHALASAGARDLPRMPARHWWRIAAALGTAAVIVLAVRVTDEPQPPPPSGTPSAAARDQELSASPTPPLDLARLGAIELPRFTPPRLRSGAAAARRAFLSAMDVYNQGDCPGAIPGLEQAVRDEPTYSPARFFLAACFLQLDRQAEAIDHLQQVTRVGESPYLEDAHWFLAKGFIRRGEWDAARRELRTVVALEGDRREDATRLLTELP